MIREELEFLSDIRDFTTLFQVILRCKSLEWIETSIESDFGTRFAIWSLDLAIRDFAFFKHCFYCKNRSFKKSIYLLIFENRSASHHPGKVSLAWISGYEMSYLLLRNILRITLDKIHDKILIY